MSSDDPDTPSGLLEPDTAPERAAADDLHARLGGRRTGQDLANHARLHVEGERIGTVFLLRRGWAMAYREFADGRRHVQDLLLPGDAVGLTEATANLPGPGSRMLTAGEAVALPYRRLQTRVDDEPDLWRLLARRAAVAESHMALRGTWLARCDAYERTALFLWTLRARQSQPGNPRPARFDCPASQHILADLLGLSPVHTNRALRKLANDRVLRKDYRHVEVLDDAAWARLIEL